MTVRTAPAVRTVRTGGLATDVCLPPEPGRHPAVVVRTPYGRRHHHAELRAWARHGFAALAQDVRGRYGSEGTWRPYGAHEAADGAATLRWVRAQDWSDGRVVAAGASYAAYCALVTALETDARPDAVLAAVPATGLAETARETTGPERLAARAGWWAAHGDRREPGTTAYDPRTLPVTAVLNLPSWPEVWAEPRRDRLVARAETAAVPLLAVGGSRDPFAGDTVRLWHAWGGPARLLLGPWGHGLTADPAPEARPGHRLDLGRLYVRWARAALAGTLTGRTGAVALGGSGHWCAVGADAAAPCPFGDRARGTAVYRFGGPAGPRPLRGGDFVADPLRPVRSDRLDVPGHGTPDRCLLLTPPLPRPLDLLGPAGARLDATADAPSADWAVRLVALDPAGRAEPLATGIVRRTRPGPFEVPLGHLARRLAAGTRLRVEVAGHHFPAHARNPHTGEDPVTATRLLASRRTVRMADSALRLPVARSVRYVDPVEEIPS